MRLGAIAALATAGLGVLWQFLESAPLRLGYEDTDDPALMLSFIRDHPEVFTQSGVVLVLMAIAATFAVLGTTPIVIPVRDSLSARAATAFGLTAAAILLFSGGIRVGSSGPLLHMAGLSQASGEAAYVAAQVASQAALISGLIALCLWIVALSVSGYRARSLPIWLSLLGILPAYRLLGGLLGPIGLLPDVSVLWLLSILAILGTFAWILLLGLVMLSRQVRSENAERGLNAR